MTEPKIPQDLYDRLMIINQEAFSTGLFDTAYHSLAAALNCAKQIDSDEPLIRIGEVSRQQLAWIDMNHPEYEHSTHSASRRSHDSIFTTLARQTDAILQMRKTSRKREQHGTG